MAGKNPPERHHPDVQRDFETGTVNPGPGMAPPHRADDTNPEHRAEPARADTPAPVTGPGGAAAGSDRSK